LTWEVLLRGSTLQVPSSAPTRNFLRLLKASFGLPQDNRRKRASLRMCLKRWRTVCRVHWRRLMEARTGTPVYPNRMTGSPRVAKRRWALHAPASADTQKISAHEDPRDPSSSGKRCSLAVCPEPQCRGTMIVTASPPSIGGTGLQAVWCVRCGHQGFVTTEAIIILFGGQHEHVCSYGPSTLTLTVTFSASALRRLRTWGTSPASSAACVTQWALLHGQLKGTVWVSDETLLRVQQACSLSSPVAERERHIESEPTSAG
jgi:hypothetical protein